MTRPLEGKTALVTGGGVGIGEAIVIGLAEAGARVALTYLTHEPSRRLRTAVKQATGTEPFALRLDATDPVAVQAAVTDVSNELGGLDILVTNAGGMVARQSVAEMSYDLWQKVMAVNLDSTFLVVHHALPHMRDDGRVITMASLAASTGGSPRAAAYAASKAAVIGFTRGLAKELAPRGITVNALAPGFIGDTPFHETFTPPEARERTIAATPARRPGVPADVAGPTVWLASPAAAFVTGTTVEIDGGRHLG